MDALVLHTKTAEQLLRAGNNPAQAMAIIAAVGSGKRTLAVQLAAEILHIEPDDLTNYPYFLLLNDADQTIQIEHIRELQHFTQLKTTGKGTIRRAIIVLAAEKMTTEAQNAFLKLLEEPPSDTIVILTVESERALLPTIMSRVQALAIQTPDEQQIRAHFSAQYPEDAVNKAYFLSGGRPGLMHALLAEEQNHPLITAVNQAKDILQKPVFERLAMVDALSKKKDEATYVLAALQQIAETGLAQAAKTAAPAKIKQWHNIIAAAYAARTALARNANAKLVFTNLMLAL
ncbi:MAG TPA: hypothetical protein VLG11_05785 [Candidatus Saccharimonadales bacterium]|nr:hypothetical protein [Candidatus Saccharimonadales bacterium]